MKIVTHNLWNISKYFTKLQKQLNQKKFNGKSKIIHDFIEEYRYYKSEIEIMNYKNASKLEKEMKIFKDRIAKLKDEMKN